MYYVVYLYILLMVFSCIKSLIRLCKSKKFLNSNANNRILLKKHSKVKVVIPAMNEVNNVKKSVNYFKKLSNFCEVIYVTTSKEKNMSTYNEIKKEIPLIIDKSLDYLIPKEADYKIEIVQLNIGDKINEKIFKI